MVDNMRVFGAIRTVGYHARLLCRQYPSRISVCFRFLEASYQLELTETKCFLISRACLVSEYPRYCHIKFDLVKMPS